MPPELQTYLPSLPVAMGALGGLVAGWIVSQLFSAPRRARLEEQAKGAERQIASLEARLNDAETEVDESDRHAQSLHQQLIEARTRLEADSRAAAEKQALLIRAEERLSYTFKSLSADALKSSTEQFLQLAHVSLRGQADDARAELEQRRQAIEHLIRPVAESLGRFEGRIGELEKARVGAYVELQGQVRALAEGQLGLQRETAQLVKALRQPAGRGQWGEMQLRRVVELAGMQEHCDFTLQTTTQDDDGRRLRPDLIVHLPGGRHIVVDAKTPMDAYLDALESTDDTAREDAIQRHARQVRAHVIQLSSKNYAAQFDTSPEFTVLFLPSESFFSAALQGDPALIEHGVAKGIILATPTTLIALFRAVAYGWRQETLADNAREIAALGRTMHERLATLTGHFSRLGKSLESAVGHYNAALGSYETRVLGAARRFEELEAAAPGESLPELAMVESGVRPPVAPAAPASGEPEDFAVVTKVSPPPALPGPEEKALSVASDLRSALQD